MVDIVFISRQRIVGPTNGSSVYLLDLARAVREAGMVPHLVQPSPSLMGRTPLMRLGPDLSVFASHRIRGVARFGTRVLSRDPVLYARAVRGIVARLARRIGLSGGWTQDRPAPYSVAVPWTAADHRFVAQAVAGASVVLADYFFQTAAFDDLPAPRPATGIVMHDLFHRRAGSSIAGATTDSVARVTRETEVAALASADAVIAIQPAEGDFVRAVAPGVTVIEAPMAARHLASAPQPGAGGRLLFVGSGTAPNVVGLRWFFDSVWPAVRAGAPGIVLDVVGGVGPAMDGAIPEGVTVHGMVDDLAAHYAAAGVVISPLTFGSGLKIKLVEALAHGKAMVATSITLQGAEDCAAVLEQADDPAAFAAAILALSRDDARRAALAAAALAFARERFSPAVCYGAFVAWLRAAVAQRSGAAS